MDHIVRALMWIHFVYLLLLPSLAVVAAFMMFPNAELPKYLCVLGFPAVLMYSLFLANGYAIPRSLPVALFITLTIPFQIALNVLLFGSGSIWLFFAESAAVSIGSFVFGTIIVALSHRKREVSRREFIFLLMLAVPLFFGGLIPHFLSVFYGYGGWSPWLVLFATAFITAAWEYGKVYRRVEATPGVKNVPLEFDGGRLAKVLGISDTKIQLMSPTYPVNGGPQRSGRVFTFGITAMLLPFITAMAIEFAFGLY